MDGGSSSKYTIPPLDGENFEQWSKLMHQLLYKEGLLFLVEDGFEEQDAENEFIRINRMHDLSAKAIILEHLSDDLHLKFSDAPTSKKLWDRLQRKYNPKGKVIEKKVPRTNEEGPSESVRIICQSNSGRNADSSRETNVINLILTNNAFEPKFQLQFPDEVREMLPSTNIIAQVACNGETYSMKFYGRRDPKWLGSGWRKFAEDHELKTGDNLEFEIVKSMNSELHLKLTMYKEKGYVPRRFRYIVYSDESDED